MSYDISFRAKVEGIDYYADIGGCEANITWNVRKMIEKSTGLPWLNEENNGLCTEIIPKIRHGLDELQNRRSKYLKYESPNGWGTVDGTVNFYKQILRDWEYVCDFYPPELVEKLTFWIL